MKEEPGEFLMHFLPYNKKLNERVRELRKNMTEPEKKLWRFLRTLEYPILRQRIIDNFIADFYCAKLKLVIEVDGDSHFTDEGKIYDEERTKILECFGLKVIRFTNYDVMNNFECVCEKIIGQFYKSLQIHETMISGKYNN
jgi:very-short-patch-repair endonuclease